MKPLITPEAARVLPPMYSTEETPPGEKICYVKLFLPEGRWTWYLLEYDPEEKIAFAWVVSGLGPDCDEYGYVDIRELESLRSKLLHLEVERDLYWTPTPLKHIPGCPEYNRVSHEAAKVAARQQTEQEVIP